MDMVTKNKRAIVFIDGNNFYHRMLSNLNLTLGTGFDYATFSRKLVDGREWVETRYYIGKIKKQGDITAYDTQQKFFAHLESQGIKICCGRFEMQKPKKANKYLHRWLHGLSNRNDKLTLPDKAIDELTKISEMLTKPTIVEKAVDVMIATDMISMAHENKFDTAYLVSADSDFAPVVKNVKDIAKETLVASPQHSEELKQAANTFIRMNDKFFVNCWLDRP